MYKVLILNSDGSAYDIKSWKKAFKLIFSSQNVKRIVDYTHHIRDGRGNLYPIPAVLQLTNYQGTANRPAPYSKHSVFIRDLYRCQYCSRHLKREECTVDHIIPKHSLRAKKFEGRFSTFENVVTSCKRCNSRKGSRTPEQASMKLLSKPKRLTRAQLFQNKLYLSNVPTEWEPYLNVKKTQ